MTGISRFASNVVLIFTRNQLLKSATIAGLLMGGGDALSQLVVEKNRKGYNYERTIRFGLIGFMAIGPILFKWYGVLEKLIVFKNPAVTVVAKMLTDQLVFAPFFLAVFLSGNGALQGQGLREIEHNIKRDYPDILLANYKLWPAAQILNFWLIPLSHRVLFAQSVALFWNTYLAWKTNLPGESLRVETSKITSSA